MGSWYFTSYFLHRVLSILLSSSLKLFHSWGTKVLLHNKLSMFEAREAISSKMVNTYVSNSSAPTDLSYLSHSFLTFSSVLSTHPAIWSSISINPPTRLSDIYFKKFPQRNVGRTTTLSWFVTCVQLWKYNFSRRWYVRAVVVLQQTISRDHITPPRARWMSHILWVAHQSVLHCADKSFLPLFNDSVSAAS